MYIAALASLAAFEMYTTPATGIRRLVRAPIMSHDATTIGSAAESGDTTRLAADLWAARCEARDLRTALDAANAKIKELTAADPVQESTTDGDDNETESPDEVTMPIFDALDDNGDGVLTREEWQKGYAVLMSETATESFELIDKDGNGVLSRDEFKKGYDALMSGTARAKVQRENIERAVAAERVRATKEAARLLAEAELMDILNAPTDARTRRAGAGLRGRGAPKNFKGRGHGS